MAEEGPTELRAGRVIETLERPLATEAAGTGTGVPDGESARGRFGLFSETSLEKRSLAISGIYLLREPSVGL